MSNARSSASVRVTGRYLSSEQMFSTVVPCGTRTTRVNKFLSFLLSLSYMDSIRKHPPAGGKPCLISTLSKEQICSHSDMPDRHIKWPRQPPGAEVMWPLRIEHSCKSHTIFICMFSHVLEDFQIWRNVQPNYKNLRTSLSESSSYGIRHTIKHQTVSRGNKNMQRGDRTDSLLFCVCGSRFKETGHLK